MQTSFVGAEHARASHAVRSSRSQHLICMKSTKGDLCAIAGGLGLAAVQLAKAAGANVLATAGSVQKRMHLREQGVQNVVSSRTLQFAEHFGCSESAQPSIVLNSLTSPGFSSPSPQQRQLRASEGAMTRSQRYTQEVKSENEALHVQAWWQLRLQLSASRGISWRWANGTSGPPSDSPRRGLTWRTTWSQ